MFQNCTTRNWNATMSSELAETAMQHRIDDEAYEVPTYDEAFPPMAPGAGDAQPRGGGVSPPVNKWAANKMVVRSSTVTQVCSVSFLLHVKCYCITQYSSLFVHQSSMFFHVVFMHINNMTSTCICTCMVLFVPARSASFGLWLQMLLHEIIRYSLYRWRNESTRKWASKILEKRVASRRKSVRISWPRLVRCPETVFF